MCLIISRMIYLALMLSEENDTRRKYDTSNYQDHDEHEYVTPSIEWLMYLGIRKYVTVGGQWHRYIFLIHLVTNKQHQMRLLIQKKVINRFTKQVLSFRTWKISHRQTRHADWLVDWLIAKIGFYNTYVKEHLWH